MMSVPIATCTVNGTAARRGCGDAELRVRALLVRAVRANGLSEPEAVRHALGDRAIEQVPVSSAIPKRPGPNASSTSSEVEPARAISKSWMIPAPLVARADTNPRSHQIDEDGCESPVLSTWARKTQYPSARVPGLDEPLRPRRGSRRRPGCGEGRAASPPDRRPGDRAWRNPLRGPCSGAMPAGRCGRRQVEFVIRKSHGAFYRWWGSRLRSSPSRGGRDFWPPAARAAPRGARRRAPVVESVIPPV